MKIITLTLVFFVVSLSSWGHDSLTLLTEDSPPQSMVDSKGTLYGPAPTIIKEIQRRINDKSPIQVLPWNRVYQKVLTTPNTAAFLMTHTDQRNKLFQWVCPLMNVKWIFLAPRNSTIKIHSLNDAKKIRSIGTYFNDAKEQFLKSNGFQNLDSSPYDLVNVKKLREGRIDIWMTSTGTLNYLQNKKEIEHDEFKPLFTMSEETLCLAFSLKTDPKIVEKWQKGLNSMIKDGTLDKINKTKQDSTL